jgi:segregation and condensation protein B
MNKEQLSAKIEALLFIYGEPMTYKKIAATLGITEEQTREAAQYLNENMKGDARGLFLITNDGKIQLTTKPEYGKLLEDIVKEEMSENLTTASLETLAIVMYAGPISRAEIDYIRGVNSSFILRSLSIRGLVDRAIDPKRSNVYLYKASIDLLKLLGLANVESLPDYQKFNNVIDKMRNPQTPTENNAGN